MEQRSCTADEAEERPASSTPAPGSTVGSAGAGPGSVAGSQHYSLRWNNHQHHLLNAFELLLQNESLVDCTIMCEDAGLRAHRVVLSACSPYFQKIFIENPGKHPIIVLKDVYCWEMQSILDFMYKGETSVPEAQLTCLIKTAESLKIRGLTSSDQLPHGASLTSSPTNLSTGYRGYSPSPSPHHHHHRYSDSSKLTQLSSSHGLRSNESSPLSLTHVDQLSDRASGRASPVPSSNCPRRKQARPRRRSGDSINSSLDLSKPGSPPLSYSGGSHGEGTGRSSGKHGDSPNNMSSMDDTGPENLSLKRSSSPGAPGPHSHHNPHHPPAINLVKMEQLVDSDRSNRMDMVEAPECKDRDDIKHFSENGMKHAQEQEALQALNFMANSGGIPSHMIPPGGHHGLHHGLPQPHFPPLSTGSSKGSHSTGSQYGSGGHHRNKGQHSAPRGGPPRSWTNDDLTKALEMVWNKRMTTSQASRVFGIPYNSLLMYVRGKYGKSLRLDVLKKNTPAANDNLNTIGNSRSTPKEKNIKREEAKEKLRKASQDSYASAANALANAPPPPFPPMFPFEPPGVNPFNPTGGLLPFSPLGEPPIGLFGMPNAEFRIKDLMQSMQNLHNQNMLAEGEKLKANLLTVSSHSRSPSVSSSKDEGLGLTPNKDNIHMGLASLLIKAKEIQDQGGDSEPILSGDEKVTSSGSESGKTIGSTSSSAGNNSSGISEDMETDIESIPAVAIKPLASSTGAATTKAIDIKIPSSANEISAQ